MSRQPKITIDSSVPLNLEVAMGFDGETFYIANHGVVIAKRGRPGLSDAMLEAMSDEDAYSALREWHCVEPGWSVVETRRPKKAGMGSLHFKFDPPRVAS